MSLGPEFKNGKNCAFSSCETRLQLMAPLRFRPRQVAQTLFVIDHLLPQSQYFLKREDYHDFAAHMSNDSCHPLTNLKVHLQDYDSFRGRHIHPSPRICVLDVSDTVGYSANDRAR